MMTELQKLLLSDKTEDILKGLELSKKKGSLKDVALICDLLNHREIEQFEKTIIEILSTIRIKEANTEIVDAIYKSKENKGNIRALMQVCWQSQLDFTQHLTLFTDIFIESDYLSSLEAFTVIENIWMDYTFNEELQSLLIDKLKDSLSDMDDDKLLLTKELIQILEG